MRKLYNLISPHKDTLWAITLISLMLITTSAGFAQSGSVSGKVIDSDGVGLPGATVQVKGTSSGTITDFNGDFKLDGIDAGQQTLIVSFVGFEDLSIPVTIKAGETAAMGDVKMANLDKFLEEVVVIGYGVQKKKLSTGATVQVKGEELEKMRTTNALQAMQGQTAGVNITSTSGQPGEGMKVTIRGLGTIGNSDPLYIVDGVQVGDITYLNNSDIESIDVLKDAASAAIYGSQSANGVVLITTKTGKKGKSQINIESSIGIQNVAKRVEMLNARDYAMIMNEQHLNSGGNINSLPFDLNNLPAYVESGSADTDWLDEMLVENALTQNYSVNATGGSEKMVYSLSLGYTGQAGIVGGSDYSNYERYTARLNTESNYLNGKLKLGQHLTLAYVDKKGIGVGNQYNNNLRGAFNTSPLLPMYDNNGDFFNSNSPDYTDQFGNTYWLNTEANPYAGMVYGNNNEDRTQKLIGDVYAVLEPIEGLKFRTSVNIDYYASQQRTFNPIYKLSLYSFSDYSSVNQNMSSGMTLAFDQTVSYDKVIGDHTVQAMAGFWMRSSKSSWMFGANTHMAFGDMEHAWLSNATNVDEASQMELSGGPFEHKMQSYFGRLQYNFKEKYMFNATFRADASSNFHKDNRWGYFPSFSAGWVLSNEEFMSPIKNVVEFLKLRGSWGQVGNQNIGAFNYLAPIKFTQATYNFGDTEGTNVNGAYPSRLSNEKLKWETSEQINIGFDARFLAGKLTANFDWYRKSTKDWLVIAPILATAGTDAPYINGGDIINAGVELGLNYSSKIGELSYNIGINGSYNINEIQNIPTDDETIHGSGNTLYNNSSEFYRAQSGYAIGYFWGWETAGIFQNSVEVQSYQNADGIVIQPDAEPGDFRYVDQNGDGKINEADKVDLGDPNPDFVFGLNLSCNYKAFDFLLSANGVAGNQIVQSYRNHANKYANYTTNILDRWTGEGTSNTVPRVTNSNVNYLFSDAFVQNGDYLRINNVTIGFDVAKAVKVPLFSQLRIYATAQNLYTFTKYDGMDPEVGYGFDNGDTDKFSRGIDLGYYPRARTFLFGVSLKF